MASLVEPGIARIASLILMSNQSAVSDRPGISPFGEITVPTVNVVELSGFRSSLPPPVVRIVVPNWPSFDGTPDAWQLAIRVALPLVVSLGRPSCRERGGKYL